jgi:hypothetical protein
MLRLIKRWLGFGDPAAARHASRVAGSHRPSSATSHLYKKDSPAMRKTVSSGNRAHGSSSGAATKPARKKNDFDPYNTGKFDRGASWEKISKNQR